MNGSMKATALACLGGLLAGAVGGWWAGRELFPKRWSWEQQYEQVFNRFSSELKLTPDQQPKVKALLDAKRQKMEALRAEMRPRREEIRQAARADIRALLTPEQQPRFDEIEKEWEELRAKRRASR